LKAQVTVAGRRVLDVRTGKGREHDCALYKRRAVPPHPATSLLADRGYQGIQHRHARSTTPHKRRRGQPLTPQQRQENRVQAQQRVIVEQVLGALKTFRILAGRYRHRRARFGLRYALIAGLYNARL
jgi:hypothetical protein